MTGDTELANRLGVFLCRVSDIGLPAITRIAVCQTMHNPIARDLGDNGGGGDREAQPVAFDDSLHRASERRSNGAIHKRSVRAHPENRDRAGHRQQRRAQNVEAVNFNCARRANADMSSATVDTVSKRTVAALALHSRQHLRIIEPVAQHFWEPAGLEDYCGGDDGPSQRPAPGLVDTAHQTAASPLDREIRHRLFPPRRLCHDTGRPGKSTAHGRSSAPLKDRYFDHMAGSVVRRRALWPGRTSALILGVVAAPCFLAASPAGAFDLLARHEVTAQFATPDGKPMANAEVSAFAPGDPSKPAVTGRTDAEGKFSFAADRDGFWSAEARSRDYVARVMIRVGGEQQSASWFSSVLVVGFLVGMLALAVWYRLLRARALGRRS